MSFAAEWARCAPWLEAALEAGGRSHNLDDVAAMIRRGEAGFWPGEACAVVTLVQDEPLERRLLVWLAGGDLGELRSRMLPRVERWARSNGCRRLFLVGRAGWERALRPNGFAPLARLIAKEL